MSEAELSLAGEALWNSGNTQNDGLPENTSLYDWAFLSLPEPTPGLAEERFRLKWLSTIPSKDRPNEPDSTGTITMSFPNEPTNPASLEDTLWNLGAAFSFSAQHGSEFELSSEEPRLRGRVGFALVKG